MYKMKGFTYPGKSPVKLFGIGARKKAEKEAAEAGDAEDAPTELKASEE